MFVRNVNILSYVYAVLITLFFTSLINFVMRKVLDKIDMVESLKSVEQLNFIYEYRNIFLGVNKILKKY